MSTEVTAIQVMETTDYDSFQLMGGNRLIDSKHVEKLRAAMAEDHTTFRSKPAVVNEEGFVVDGQHRLQAAKIAGLPFYYVVADRTSLITARKMNILQKQWTLRDYAESYASGGNQSYKTILQLSHKFPALPISSIIEIAADYGGQAGEMRRAFKDGLFEIDDIGKALSSVEFFNKVQTINERKLNTSFIRTLMLVRRRDDFEEGRFMSRLEMGARFSPAVLSKDNYRQIEDVYNYHISDTHKVRFY